VRPGDADLDDPRVQLAARELKKLPPETLDKLLQALAALRTEIRTRSDHGSEGPHPAGYSGRL